MDEQNGMLIFLYHPQTKKRRKKERHHWIAFSLTDKPVDFCVAQPLNEVQNGDRKQWRQAATYIQKHRHALEMNGE